MAADAVSVAEKQKKGAGEKPVFFTRPLFGIYSASSLEEEPATITEETGACSWGAS